MDNSTDNLLICQIFSGGIIPSKFLTGPFMKSGSSSLACVFKSGERAAVASTNSSSTKNYHDQVTDNKLYILQAISIPIDAMAYTPLTKFRSSDSSVVWTLTKIRLKIRIFNRKPFLDFPQVKTQILAKAPKFISIAEKLKMHQKQCRNSL